MSECACNTLRTYAPGPTVSAPKVPLYQLGSLGDDYFGNDPNAGYWNDVPQPGDTVDSTPPFVADVTYPPTFEDMVADPNLIPTTPTSGNNNVVYGPPAAGQPGSTVASSAGSVFSNLISSIFKPNAAPNLAPGPAPRVAYGVNSAPSSVGTWFQQNAGLLALGGIGLVAVSALAGGRRRR